MRKLFMRIRAALMEACYWFRCEIGKPVCYRDYQGDDAADPSIWWFSRCRSCNVQKELHRGTK